MLSEYRLPSFNVWLVTNDSSLKIGAEKSRQTEVVLAFLEHVERGSALTLIWRLPVLTWIEKQNEILTLNSKDLRTLNLFVIWSKLFQVRCPKVIEQIPVHRPIGLLSACSHII